MNVTVFEDRDSAEEIEPMRSCSTVHSHWRELVLQAEGDPRGGDPRGGDPVAGQR